MHRNVLQRTRSAQLETHLTGGKNRACKDLKNEQRAVLTRGQCFEYRIISLAAPSVFGWHDHLLTVDGERKEERGGCNVTSSMLTDFLESA